MRTEVELSPQSTHPAANVFGHCSPARPRVSGVVAEVSHVSPETERPYTFIYRPPEGTAWDDCKYQVVPVQIADARAMALPPSIDVEGFELSDAPTSVTDFSDEDAIQRRYYPEAVELAKQVTGADHAMIFDHAIQRRESGRPALSFGRNRSHGALGAVGRVHVDYSETSARDAWR